MGRDERLNPDRRPDSPSCFIGTGVSPKSTAPKLPSERLEGISKKRSAQLIRMDILYLTMTPIRKLALIYRGGIGWRTLNKHLTWLLNEGFVKHAPGRRYVATEEGLTQLKEMMNGYRI